MTESDRVSPSPALPPVSGTLVPQGIPTTPEGVPSGEACPPPLVWQEVLATFTRDSHRWEIDQGSRRLAGRTWGEGPPLYVLPGFAATAELFALLIYLLRENYRCVVYDTRSRRRGRVPEISDYAADLQAAMDYHGDPAAHVFAANFGSAPALRTALDCPDRIRSLVCLHGLPIRQLSWTEWLLAKACRWSVSSLSSLPMRRRVQEWNHRRWFPPFDGTRFEFLVESTGKIPLRDLSEQALALNRLSLTSELSRVSVPVLLIRTEGQGNQDAEAQGVVEQALPTVRTESLHSTGLHPYLTHPHRLAKLIKGFCVEQPAADPRSAALERS